MKRVLIVLAVLVLLAAGGRVFVVRQASRASVAPTLWYFSMDKGIFEGTVPLAPLAAALGNAFGDTTREVVVDPSARYAKTIFSRELGVGFVPARWLLTAGKEAGVKPLYWIPPDSHDTLAIVVKSDSSIKSLADLQGKKGAMPAPLQRAAGALLQAAKLDPKQAFASLAPIPLVGQVAGSQAPGGPKPVTPRQLIGLLKEGTFDFLILSTRAVKSRADKLSFLRVLHEGPARSAAPTHAIVVSVTSGPELAGELAKALPAEVVSKFKIQHPDGDYAAELAALGGDIRPGGPGMGGPGGPGGPGQD
ncbi:MAG: hypothetical protein FD129_1901 [bacterium]|nr:MAG: hypothetical protein FD129_1901 [bacterium]